MGAAEKHFRRAKDTTRLLEAVELKLSEQRRFVLWWDQQVKAGGSLKRGKGPALPVSNAGKPLPEWLPEWDSLATVAGLGVEVGLNRVTVHRWRTRLKNGGVAVAAPPGRGVKLGIASSVCNAIAAHKAMLQWPPPPGRPRLESVAMALLVCNAMIV
jgi:hypothetical protein